MTAGFEVIGDHGSTQIDENFYNMAFITSGTITSSLQPLIAANYSTTSLSPTDYETNIAAISYSGTAPIIAIDTRSNLVSHFMTTNDGAGNFVFYFLTYTITSFYNSSNGTTTYSAASNPTTFAYYIFDIMPNVQANNQGLTVWNASGKVTFNSDYEPMRMIGFYQCSDGYSLDTSFSPSVPIPPAATTGYSSGSAQKIAVCAYSSKGYEMFGAGSSSSYIQTIKVNNSATTPYFTTEGGTDYGNNGEAPMGPFGTAYAPGYSNSHGCNIVMVDITNHFLG